MSPQTPGLTPAAAAYLAVMVLVVTPGIVGLTTLVRQRFGPAGRASVNAVYASLTLLVAAAGCLVWPRQLGSGHGTLGLLGSLVVGAALTWPVARVDLRIARRLARSKMRQAAASGPAVRPARARTRVVPAGIAASPGPASPAANRRAAAPVERSPDELRRPPAGRSSAGWLVAVAVGEELLYRGAILGWARNQVWPLAVVVAVVLTAVFCVVHCGFGWHQVVAKVPLALATLAVASVSGSVWGAAVLHGLFNLWYWRRGEGRTPSPAGSSAVA